MRLLIVDDEKLTREGISQILPWRQLGIEQVQTAVDGLDALHMASAAMPDILLSDIRMPRMDGISLASRLQALRPEMPIIFMSGYSDKAYLKAAIRLKALSYVEKPIDPAELEEALKEAISHVKKHRENRDKITTSLSRSREILASRLTKFSDESSIIGLLSDADLLFLTEKKYYFFTMILPVYSYFSTEENGDAPPNIMEFLCEKYDFGHIFFLRQPHLWIFHLWSLSPPDREKILSLAEEFCSHLSGHTRDFHLAIGPVQNSIGQCPESYTCGVLALQKAFFSPTGSLHFYGEPEPDAPGLEQREEVLSTIPPRFRESLLQQDAKQAQLLLDQVFALFQAPPHPLPHQAKAYYFRLLDILEERQSKSRMPAQTESPSEAWGHLLESPSLASLHQVACQRLQRWSSQISSQGDAGRVVAKIKAYISTHYHSEGLSIQDISGHVYLSASYVCTLFKQETGSTLNQYLTEYRLDKAKEFLQDPSQKIQGIAARVGYGDSHYFGKLFKKMTGLTPSEYREAPRSR